MHQAIPYKTWAPISSDSRSMATAMIDRPGEGGADASERLKRVVEENPVLVFGQRGCFMCHVVNRLLLGHGVKAVVWEVEEGEESSLVQEIAMMPGDQRLQFPAVFIGGRFVGGIDRLISLHISGDLVPILKEAGALWL
ncbi:glutaredoxin-C9-like protein [Cinnamomum micranthum f. kanehirae]|uniref:Glutaredoxin-C9-like protein n=1 Tax=Cinnamomum micranthum f. kanehirae TaxID=337451 RepID=A0A3S3NLH2_9MAGN|nr:glutaredoxin-C9-like protein [Cinnamomum micranthum f. kanehirae]